jgi:hypothetical protein
VGRSRYDSSGVRPIALRHPLGGLDRARAHQDQPPFTTPSANNVFPTDSLGDRSRIGQRPGVLRAYQQQLGSGNPIRMLSSVSRVTSSVPRRWSDDFDAAISTGTWDTKVGGGAATLTYDSVRGGMTSGEALRSSLSIDTTKPYTIEVDFTRPILGQPIGNTLEILVFVRYDNTTPAHSGGACYAKIYIGNEVTTATCEIYEDGALLATSGLLWLDGLSSGTIQVRVNDGNVAKKVTVNFAGADRVTATLSAANNNSKQRLGLYVETGIWALPTNAAAATAFRVIYTSSLLQQAIDASVCVASSNGLVYADNPSGTILPGQLTQIAQTTALALSADKRLQATDLLQKLYIADYHTKHIGSGYTSTSGNITGTDWTLLGIDTDEDVVIISTQSGTVPPGVYRIASVGATNLVLTGMTGNSAGGLALRIERAMKVYDPSHATQQLSIWTTTTGKGVVPHGCSIITRYSNSLLLGGDPQAPHVWYMSRRDDPNDFDFGASSSDRGRAVAGTSTGTSTIGQPLTAIVPFFADYCIFASAKELWLMRGDPRLNGGFDRISPEVGIIDRFAWCISQQGNMYVLATTGLYVLDLGPNPIPRPLSRNRIPAELLNIDTASVEVSMGYDPDEDGVLICLTPTDGSATTHYFYSVRLESFWPITMPAGIQPRLLYNLPNQTLSLRGLAQGGSDGYIRKFSRKQYFDDAPALSLANKLIAGRVQYGPFGPGSSDATVAALVHTIEATLAQGSRSVTWSIYAADSPEQVIRATTPVATGTWTNATVAARTIREMVRTRGGAFILEIAGADQTAAGPWAVENLTARIGTTGPLRVL